MSLPGIEALTRKIYGAYATPEERMEAHRSLLSLQLSASYVDVCTYILKSSNEPTALLYAAQSLLLVFSRDWANFSMEGRFALREFLVDLLSSRAMDANHFFTKKLVQVLCSLTRRAWVEDARFADILTYATQWIKQPETCELGLRYVLLQYLPRISQFE